MHREAIRNCLIIDGYRQKSCKIMRAYTIIFVYILPSYTRECPLQRLVIGNK